MISAVRRFARLFIVIAAGAAILFGGMLAAWAAVAAIPSIDNFESRRVSESTKIYDRTGNVLLYDVHGAMRRTAVPLEDISLHIRNATIAIEDDTFYQHRGIRPLATLRAIFTNVTRGNLLGGQGGSTITQQVVKNTLLTKDKTIIRKVKEWVLAVKLERVYTKDKILETYLNETPYGGTLYGVEEASQYFFGVSASDVTLAQAAYLAALPQAPTRYSPYGSRRDELETRKNLVLERMLINRFITQEEYDAAHKEEVVFKDEKEAGIKAPHFVFFVREYLEEKYGVDAVANGGLQIVTTLDYDLQKKAEDVIALRAPEMEKNFDASNTGLVAIDPKTGQILTMVGSRGYFETDIDGAVNITLAKRQPGSSFKPFVYATAFEKGYTPETVVFDLKTQFSTYCTPDDFGSEDPCYSPENFDGKFQGPITFRNALAQSVNVPAVKVVYLAGVENSIRTAERLGITTLGDANRYGLTLVLGGGEVQLLELTDAYATFANDGIRNPAAAVLQVRDASGKVLEEFKEKPSRVLAADIARTVNDILADNVARTPEFGAASPLYFPGYDVAAKTGTTNDYRDAWILGYTPGIVAGAWAGNNDNTPMQKKIAAFIITPMWHEFMAYALTKYPSETFPPLPAEPNLDSLPTVLRGEWNTDAALGVHDILYWIDKDHPRSGSNGDMSDPQLARWDYAVSLWAKENVPEADSRVAPGSAHTKGPLVITSPANGSVQQRDAPIAITAEHPDPSSVSKVTFYLNDKHVGSVNHAPYIIFTTPKFPGKTTLRAIVETKNGTTEESSVTFTAQ